MREGDRARVLELLPSAYGRWPRVEVSVPAIEHLHWKLSSSPNAIRYSTVAETPDSRIIGVQLLFVRDVKVGSKVLSLNEGVDLCVDPAYQNQGVMADMRRFAWPTFYKVFDMRIGQTGRVALDKLRRREGSQDFGNQIEVLVHDLEARTPARKTGWAIRDIPRFDERIDDFWRAASTPFRFILVRTSELLNWRYDPRAGRFAIKVAELDGTILGYVVASISHEKGHIADLLVLPDRLDVAASLVESAVGHCSNAGASKIECWLPTNHPYREVLRDAGFTHRKRTVPLTYGAFRAPEDDLAFLSEPDAALHYVSGDLDVV